MHFRPLTLPNLPQGPVSAVAISQRAPESVRKSLENLGIRIVTVTPYSRLPVPEQCHPDMLLAHLGGCRILVADASAPYLTALHELGFQWELAEKPPEGHYPDTVALNALLLEDKLIGLLPSVDKKINESLQSSKHQQIFCRQGYTRCSVCVVSSHAVITEDPSIYKALTKFVPSIEALLISPGAVHLDGYAHGFIGGCCGLLDQRILAFTGDIRMHPDFAAIKTFLFRHGVQYYTLSTSQLEDIGGIMPLCE